MDGTVLEISPTSRYTVYCTVDGAYGDPETELVHTGEQLYLRCTANGTHRAVGVVTSIDGAEIELPTALELGGSVYGMLRAQGLVAKDFTLEISADQQIVRVGGAQYLLNGGELATN